MSSKDFKPDNREADSQATREKIKKEENDNEV